MALQLRSELKDTSSSGIKWCSFKFGFYLLIDISLNSSKINYHSKVNFGRTYREISNKIIQINPQQNSSKQVEYLEESLV